MNSPNTPLPLPHPSPELPPYPGLRLEQVHLCATPEAVEAALPHLLAVDSLGFDTESKPTFRKGEESTGPHLLQLANDKQAWLIPLGGPLGRELAPLLKPLLESEQVLKVGFGLKDDVKRMAGKFGIELKGVVDLSVALRGIQRHDFGAKSAVAYFFGQALRKSKKVSTTNWARLPYSPAQMLYAADDAQVALKVYREWLRRKAEGTLPVAAPAPARKPRPSIALIGMPGVGKSTVGHWLAERLGLAFIDTDRLIEALAGQSLQQIIDSEGVARLLELENRVLGELDETPAVISTGGSAVYCVEGMAHLRTIATVVHLQCDLPELLNRIPNRGQRGIVMAPGQPLEALFAEREPLYRKYTRIVVATQSKTPEAVGEEVLQRIGRRRAAE
ncbi:MAG TPA: shikimate kinase [Rhodocyclaceae bacterium]|nr:shikimate kinase [Rhodocyclaceae bacterium]